MIVEIKQGFFVYQHVLFARFVFQRGDVFNQLFIVGKKGGLNIGFLRHQSAADKQLARFCGCHFAVGHGAARQHGEAVEGNAFAGHHFAAFLRPMRLEIMVFHQVRRFLLDPFRLDAGHVAGVEAGGFGELGGHHPFGFAFKQGRSREQMKMAAARAQIVVAFGRFKADIGHQPGNQGAVDLLVARFFGLADVGAVLFFIQLLLLDFGG